MTLRPLLALVGLLCCALPALAVAVKDGATRPARESMAHAALLSGISLANSGLGLAHGVAAALGVTARVPHGLACAAMLPVALRVNREVCESRLAELARATLEALSASREACARSEERMEGTRRRLEDIEREIRDMLEVEPQGVAALAGYSYVFRRNFLNGWRGFIGSMINAFYAFLKEAKIYERRREHRDD